MFKEHKKQEGSVLLCIFNFFFFFLFYCCNKPNAGSDSMHITFRWRKQITYIAFSITIIFIVILLFVGDSFFFSVRFLLVCWKWKIVSARTGTSSTSTTCSVLCFDFVAAATLFFIYLLIFFVLVTISYSYTTAISCWLTCH